MFYLYRPNYFLSQLKPVPLMLECSDFYDRKQYALYERLQPGDVVWARMPFKAKKLKKIQESHHIRPYVVMAKENDEIIAYYCSTKAKQWISHYTVNAKRHDEMKKDSHVYLNQTWTLKINDLQSYYMTLENYEKLAINKMVKDTDLPSFKDVNPVTPGHIVQYENHKYLITDEIKHCYYGFEVVQQFNKKLYYVSEGNFCVSLEERINHQFFIKFFSDAPNCLIK
ncbi:MAG: hypothetical protein HUJ53_11425, partial [Holdemanella sp.]|nr:hypothetical protein [Holdemanella sp.]